MIKKFKFIVFSLAAIFSMFFLLPCSGYDGQQLDVSVLILQHFEIGELSGDFPGEVQYFYEEYFMDGDSYEINGGYTLYYNKADKIAMCVTGSGKTNASAALTAVLCDDRFCFESSKILAVGCAGGAIEYSTLGDVCIATAVYDFDLGHTADPRDLTGDGSKWFHDSTYDDVCHKELNAELAEEL